MKLIRIGAQIFNTEHIKKVQIGDGEIIISWVDGRTEALSEGSGLALWDAMEADALAVRAVEE